MVALLSGCAEKEVNDTKLKAPSSLRVSSDNVLTWSVVKGAIAYLPNINGVDCEIVTSNRFFLSDVANDGHLVIKVKAIGDGTTCFDSDWSDELEYDMIVALETPIPVVSGKTVKWDAIDGANKYEYIINGSLVRTDATTIDLSSYPSDKYTISVRALPYDNKQNTVSAWSSEVMLSIVDRLSTPVLTVVQPSLKTPEVVASVSWEPVELASGYEVYIEDDRQDCEGTSLVVQKDPGTYKVKVTAVNPEYDSSETATVTITIKGYGKGTETDPYKIYDATDWRDFVDMVSTNEGISGYLNKYLQLESDIDFENEFIKPAGVSSLLSFKGTLDGKGHTLKNAKIGDGSTSHHAFFHMLNGTVKNLYFDNITVNAGGSSSAAVISAGDSDVAFTIENCHVTNSTIAGGSSNVAGLVTKCNHSSVVITDCSVSNSTITAGNENVGAIVGSLINGTITNITATQNVLSGKSNVGGIVGTLGEATLLNVISSNNSLTVTTSSCGGVVGVCVADNGNIINVYSNANIVCCLTQSNAPYLGLIMGGHKDKNKVCNIKNTLTLSGTTSYVFDPANSTKKFAGGIGVAIGYGTKFNIQSCYYSENSRYLYDSAFYEAKGTAASTSDGLRLAIGAIVDTKAGDDKEFSAKSETELTDGTVLTALNEWVDDNKETYPALKFWSVDDNKLPKL